MKFLPFILLLLSLNSFSQAKKDSFITVNYNIDTLDLQNVYGLLDIGISKYYVPATFSRYYCDFIIEEYFEGKMVKKQSLKDSLPSMALFTLKVGEKLEKGKFRVFLYSQKIDSTLKLYITIGGAGVHKKLSLQSKAAYSWKDVYNLEEKKHPLRTNESFPIAAYTTAIGKDQSMYGDNISEFCRISGEIIPPQNWYKELGIKHFYLFSIRLVP